MELLLDLNQILIASNLAKLQIGSDADVVSVDDLNDAAGDEVVRLGRHLACEHLLFDVEAFVVPGTDGQQVLLLLLRSGSHHGHGGHGAGKDT